jgi:hypothetical protein
MNLHPLNYFVLEVDEYQPINWKNEENVREMVEQLYKMNQ